MKNSLIKMLNEKELTLIVSLPSNDIELAREAIINGADAIKVHTNVSHRASGNDFGTVEENKDFFEQLFNEFDNPIGIVPADSIEKINQKELRSLEEIGFNYFSIYMDECPSKLLNSNLEKTVAGDSTYSLEELRDIDKIGIQAFEASIIQGEEYGTPLNTRDLLRYSSIVQALDVPVIVPTQRKILPEDITYLYSTGIKAIMLGAVTIGNNNIGEKVKEYRKAIDEAILEAN